MPVQSTLNRFSISVMMSELPNRSKPHLRGVFHALAGLAAIPATVLLVRNASPGTPSIIALCYGIALMLVFGTRGLYHMPMWSLTARRKMRRLDHSMIYLLIAGSYVPFASRLNPLPNTIVLAVTVGGGLIGFIKAHAWERAPRWLTTSFYLVLGWCMVPFFPQLYERIGPKLFGLLVAGGCCYSVGALIYWRRFPNPWPRTFGYHEVNHVVGLGGAIAHYIAIWQLLTP